MSDSNNENNNPHLVSQMEVTDRTNEILDANGRLIFQVDTPDDQKIDASNDGDKKPMVFQVGADADQRIAIDFDSVSTKALGLDKIQLETVAKSDFDKIISEIEERSKSNYGYDKLSNKQTICLLEGWASDVSTNLKKMDYISIYSLAGSASNNDRNDYNNFYQKQLSEIVAISKHFLKVPGEDFKERKLIDSSNDGDKKPMVFEVGVEADQRISIGFDSVDKSGCNEYLRKVKDVLGKKLNYDDEIVAVKELIAANNLPNCHSNFEEIIGILNNTDVSTVENTQKTSELLTDALNYAYASKIIHNAYLEDAGIDCYDTHTTTPDPEL